jgi:3-oxo-5-alpha-steroid 4-dehydrogenase 1
MFNQCLIQVSHLNAMTGIFNPEVYQSVITCMIVLAVIVFIALQWIEAPYGMAYRKGWGPSLNNRVGWVLMEAPAFFAMAIAEVMADDQSEIAVFIAFLFLLHYFRRSFIFPCRMRGNSRMPLVIALMGAVFNIVNVYLIAGWLFYVAPAGYYSPVAEMFKGNFAILTQSPMPIAFIVGVVIFFCGMRINWQADNIVRHLRKPGETGHKIPYGGMFRYVSSASYFGEIVEWFGYAILSWSVAGWVFLLWTCANLVPRAGKIHQRYINEFGDTYRALNRRRVFPLIY